MLKTIFPSICVAFIIIGLAGSSCNQEPLESNIIAVSILPQKYFVEQITGGHFQVEVLVPPGSSPASYDPSPRQLARLSRASVYLKTGYIGFEKSWIPKLMEEYPHLKFIDLSEGIEIKTVDDSQHGHNHHGVEPHLWMSPKNARIIAKNIYLSVCEMNPKEKEFYTINYHSLLDSIEQLDHFIRDQLDSLPHRAFIIYHPALTYFAMEYGLEQYPIEKEGKEPSARYMEKLVKVAIEKNIRLIFIQKEFNQNEALTLENEINGKVVSIDPLSEKWMDQMKFITRQLSKELK